jgi:predicted transcriptional regulator
MIYKSIECPLCTDGKKYYELTSHIRCKHKMSLKEFREQYQQYIGYTRNIGNPYKNNTKLKLMEE